MTRPTHPHVTVSGIPSNITEAQFQALVLDLAKRTGWFVNHQLPAQIRPGKWATATQGMVGWPDLVLVHPRRRIALFRELKRWDGKLTEEQELWGAALVACGLDWAVWRPSDWLTSVASTLIGDLT